MFQFLSVFVWSAVLVKSRFSLEMLQAIGKIAAIEIPANLWLNLVDVLASNITSSSDPNLKQACFEALGYVCEEVIIRPLDCMKRDSVSHLSVVSVWRCSPREISSSFDRYWCRYGEGPNEQRHQTRCHSSSRQLS